MLPFPTAQEWDSATRSHSVLLSAKKECTERASHAMLCGKIVQTLNSILDEAEHSSRQNVLACKLLLCSVVSSDTLPSSWIGLHMALIYRILPAPLLPGSVICTVPIWILNNFLPGVSVGEAQLCDGGSSPRCKAQARGPCASFCLASLGISSDACWRLPQQCGAVGELTVG